MTLPQWHQNFVPPNLHSTLSPVWYVPHSSSKGHGLILPYRFTLFQVASAFTNAGFSLVDQSMVPFQQAYLMIVGLVFLIIAGNTGYVSSPVWTSMRCRNLFP